MSLEHPSWQGRKKRVARRVANDLRLFLPLLGLVGCVAVSATVIVAAEDAPLDAPFAVAAAAAAAPEIAPSTSSGAPAVSAAPPADPACEPGVASANVEPEAPREGFRAD